MKVELIDIHKHFGPVRANDGVSMTLEPGTIHGLLGENGAGKSTLMKCLSGYQPPDSGTIEVDGQVVSFGSPDEAIRRGIGMLHQDPLDFPQMRILDNFLLGFDRRMLPDRRRGRATLRELAERFQFDLDPDAEVTGLTIGERQQLEILRLLALGAQVIILDEPTTGISAPQKVKLFNTLRRLAEEEGRSVIFVSHKLEEAEELCHRVTVLRRGQVAGEAEMGCPVDRLVEIMFGRSLPPAEHMAGGERAAAFLARLRGAGAGHIGPRPAGRARPDTRSLPPFSRRRRRLHARQPGGGGAGGRYDPHRAFRSDQSQRPFLHQLERGWKTGRRAHRPLQRHWPAR